MESGDFLWNAGMFFGRCKYFFKSMKIHMPELLNELEKIAQRLKKGDSFDDLWQFIKPQSIDYGLLERLIIFM